MTFAQKYLRKNICAKKLAHETFAQKFMRMGHLRKITCA
jgi:hypothetical protein